MTDKYIKLREDAAHTIDLLADYDETERALILSGKMSKDTLDTVLEMKANHALLADYDRLKKDLEEIASIDWVDATFDPQMAIHIAKASLEQEQGGSDANGNR